MALKFPVGAGALGGVAAGSVLLCAAVAQAREPAAISAPGLKSMDSDVAGSGLRVLTAEGDSQPLQAVPVVRLTDLGGPPAWNPSNDDPLTCLAQAVYFEARSESDAGQQAVAQVVMNRTHLPQYANTVCGVVYQGSGRATGCQFTFVCDGPLRRPDDLAAWERATGVAKRALAGFVYKPMLTATHYHAAWMTPYWSGQLTRIRRIGGQVFYH